MYLVMASNLTSPQSWSASTSWKIGPQIGISRSPWASGTGCFPSMISFTRWYGNFPPFLCEIRVKSGTACFKGNVSGARHPRILELTVLTARIAIQSAAEALLTVRRGGIGAVWVLYDRNCHRHFVPLKFGQDSGRIRTWRNLPAG